MKLATQRRKLLLLKIISRLGFSKSFIYSPMYDMILIKQLLRKWKTVKLISSLPHSSILCLYAFELLLLHPLSMFMHHHPKCQFFLYLHLIYWTFPLFQNDSILPHHLFFFFPHLSNWILLTWASPFSRASPPSASPLTCLLWLHLPMSSCTDETMSVSSALVMHPSPFTSYNLKANLSLSYALPRRSCDKLTNRSCWGEKRPGCKWNGDKANAEDENASDMWRKYIIRMF